MRRAASIAQLVYVTLLCALLAAKMPSFVDPDAPGFSIGGALVGAAIALVALGIGTLASPLAADAEEKGRPVQLALMRGALVCFAGAMTAFTGFLYVRFDWIKLLVGAFVVSGVVCVFGANLATWVGRRTDA